MIPASLQARQDAMRIKHRNRTRKRQSAQLAINAGRVAIDPQPEAPKVARVYYCPWFYPDDAELKRIARMEAIAFRIARRKWSTWR